MASGAPAGTLGKGGKAKAGRPAKEVLDELMATRLAELKALPTSHQAKVILSIDGLGYQAVDGSFTDKKPGKTKGKSAHHYGEGSFREQFYITVGFGPGFARTRVVAVASPSFFKGGDVSKGKLIDGVINVGDYVFTKEAEGGATVSVSMSHGASSNLAVGYQDLYAVLPKAQVPEWIREGKLYL